MAECNTRKCTNCKKEKNKSQFTSKIKSDTKTCQKCRDIFTKSRNNPNTKRVYPKGRFSLHFFDAFKSFL